MALVNKINLTVLKFSAETQSRITLINKASR